MPSEMAFDGSAAGRGRARRRGDGGMDDVYYKPGHLIRRLQQIAVAVFAQECADHDVTPLQYAALVAVRDNPGLDATRVAALVAFDRSTIGNVMERLEGKGLIERRPNPDDRRVKILHLAPAGQDKELQEVEAAVDRVQERLLAPSRARASGDAAAACSLSSCTFTTMWRQRRCMRPSSAAALRQTAMPTQGSR